MQIIPHTFHESLIYRIRVARAFHMAFGVVAVFVDNFRPLVRFPEVRDLAGIQRIIDVLEEAFFLNLGVDEEEGFAFVLEILLDAGFAHEFLLVLAEILDAVVFLYLDAHEGVLEHVGGELREGLFAGPADANK